VRVRIFAHISFFCLARDVPENVAFLWFRFKSNFGRLFFTVSEKRRGG